MWQGLSVHDTVDVLVCDEHIAQIGKNIIPSVKVDRVIEANGNLLMPAFYNAHSHAAMTLFRGYGEDLPLKAWLDDKILPAEDRLNDECAYAGSMLAIAEMIRSGIVSFSDMYMFEGATARAVAQSGMKANLSRCLVSFDPDIDVQSDKRLYEALDLYKEWNGAENGRIRIDMSLHAEYTNVEKYCREVGRITKELGAHMQIHVSESAHEHTGCISRHGMTPMEFLAYTGVLDVPTVASHCVYVSDNDISIMREKGVFAVHNPVSNLKLGSGIMPYKKLKDAGVEIALGTDGVASNNNLDMFNEMRFAALIHKGVNCDPTLTLAADIIDSATRVGALSQGREDCGVLSVGKRADLILIDLSSFNNIPYYTLEATVCYSARSSDILLTMCDGRILYEHGAYNSIDEEKVRYLAKDITSHYFD